MNKNPACFCTKANENHPAPWKAGERGQSAKCPSPPTRALETHANETQPVHLNKTFSWNGAVYSEETISSSVHCREISLVPVIFFAYGASYTREIPGLSAGTVTTKETQQ